MECIYSLKRSRVYWRSLLDDSTSWKLANDERVDPYHPDSMRGQDDVSGTIRRWRVECNLEKRKAHSAYVRSDRDHLDICCGRGGDVRKVKQCNPRTYIGVDISTNAIEEACSRCTGAGLNCRLFTADVCSSDNSTLLEKLRRYEPCSISIMFALHYCFKSSTSFENFINFLNGVRTADTCTLYGIVPFWLKVRELVDESEDGVASPCAGCVLDASGTRASWPDVPNPDNCFGMAYTFALDGSVHAVEEYLVYWPVLEERLEEIGWKCTRASPVPGAGGGLYLNFAFKRSR
jgi:hypothetical protein